MGFRASSILIGFSLIGTMTFASPLKPEDGKVGFEAVVRPSSIKINGTAPGPKGDLALSKAGADTLVNGTAEFTLNDLKTGMATRDRHMTEKYLQTDKYPTAILTLKDFKVPAAIMEKGGKTTGAATLQLHGETKPVDLSLIVSPEKDRVKAAVDFNLKISDYKIEEPKFAGVVVSDEVKVHTETYVAK